MSATRWKLVSNLGGSTTVASERSETLTVGDPGLMTRANLDTLDGVQVLHHLVVHLLDNFLVERGNRFELVKPLGELLEGCRDDFGVLPLQMERIRLCTVAEGTLVYSPLR